MAHCRAVLALQERARKAAVHPTVDWLYAVLLAVQMLEEALLVPGSAQYSGPPWGSGVANKVSSLLSLGAPPLSCP